MFDIPVVVFLFRRSNTLKDIFSRLEMVKPSRIYLMADNGRNDEEKKEAEETRKLAESLISWDCEIIKNYANENRGVYENIGEGAKWVLKREKMAIFLEDDNLPEVSFFEYARDLLYKYENEDRVIWICGTNYVTDMRLPYSYTFSQHLLPCGWASWSSKFLKYYDGYLSDFNNKEKKKAFLSSYRNLLFGAYQLQCVENEYKRHKRYNRFNSWDYQMLWSIRSNGLYGIVPSRNQITNIGIDEYSTHGGTTKDSVMTDRFCEIKSFPLDFPLSHPPILSIDNYSEETLASIICPPIKDALKRIVSSKLKLLLHFDTAKSWKSLLKPRR